MTTRKPLRAIAMLATALTLTLASARPALAHCDTMDGPVVTAALHALESGDPGRALIWVRAEDEPEIRRAFAHALAVRGLGGEARTLADRHFLETIVRVHRAGEGEPYTGLKPAGADHGAAVPAADRALATGDPTELERILLHAVRDGLRERFERARAASGFAADDVAAGRAYVAAYVPLLHYVEGIHEIATGAGHAHPPAPAHAHAAPAARTGH